MPAWFFATSFAASHDFAAFIASMEPESRTPSRAWDAEAMHIDDFGLTRSDVVGLALSDLHNAIEEALRGNQGTSASGQQTAATLLTLLHPVLNSTFLEAAPTAFAPSANATAGPHRGVALCAVRIARDLWRANAAEGSQAAKADIKASRTLVDKMAAYFPFAGDDNMAYRKDSEVLWRGFLLLARLTADVFHRRRRRCKSSTSSTANSSRFSFSRRLRVTTASRSHRSHRSPIMSLRCSASKAAYLSLPKPMSLSHRRSGRCSTRQPVQTRSSPRSSSTLHLRTLAAALSGSPSSSSRTASR